MTADERRAKLRAILDEINAARRELNLADEASTLAGESQADTNEAIRLLLETHATTVRGLRVARDRHRRVIERVMAANAAALDLLNSDL